jgi:hypothetical protein
MGTSRARELRQTAVHRVDESDYSSSGRLVIADAKGPFSRQIGSVAAGDLSDLNEPPDESTLLTLENTRRLELVFGSAHHLHHKKTFRRGHACFHSQGTQLEGSNGEGRTMNEQRNLPKMRGACDRAAMIRRQWSPAEKQRRVGLPPDTPWALLRTFYRDDRRVGVTVLAKDGRVRELTPARS